jgi:hypothetical protein
MEQIERVKLLGELTGKHLTSEITIHIFGYPVEDNLSWSKGGKTTSNAWSNNT